MKPTALLLALTLLLAACAPVGDGPADVTFEYAEGTCAVNADCQWAGEGCGGGHGICTNQPELYADAVTTCDVNEAFPANQGYTCGCVEQRCGWAR